MGMNRDNISALLTALAVIALIVGFAIYFNSPELNTAGGESIRQQQLIDKILTPEPSESISSESTANGGSSEGEKARNMLVELASTRENNPVVIKLNRTVFDLNLENLLILKKYLATIIPMTANH